jgi:acetylornithine deacetylase/succinyl-diaminopimelate desuccinylase-like protein
VANGKNHVAEFAVKHEALIERLFEKIDQSRDSLIARIREIAEISAPTFHEEKRTEYLKDAFTGCELNDVHSLPKGSVLAYTRSADSIRSQDKAKEGLSRTKGSGSTEPRSASPGSGKPVDLLLAAHIDHVFPAGTDLGTHIEGSLLYGPGTGDNATNVAAILMLAELISKLDIRLAGNVAFCGTVCEEGNGNLAGIAEVLEALGDKLHAVIAVDGGASSVVNRSLAIRRYLLKTGCPGGHSWGKFGTPSAIHEMAKIVAALDAVEVPAEPKTTFNVGTIRGGKSVNAIAQECEAEIDLRSLDRGKLEKLERDFLDIVESSRRQDVEVDARLIGDRPAAVIPPDSPLVSTALNAAKRMGMEVKLSASSTDAALPMSRGIPAISFGIYHGGGGHTLQEFVELDTLTAGMKWLALTVLAFTGVKE